MLKEALQYLYDQGKERASVAAAKVLKEIPTNGTYLFVEHGGELKKIDTPASLRSHAVESVDDLIAAAEKWNKAPVVWINGQHIVLVIDDGDRRERVALPLRESAVFRCVKALAANGRFDQTALIRLLRVELRNNDQPALLAAVRKIKFRSLSAGHTDIQHGTESLGRQIENEITGADTIPESLVVSTNLFSNPGEADKSYGIGLDLEIDAAAQKFVLRPMPDEIEKVTTAALQEIKDHIEQQLPDVSVFYGTP